MSAVAWLVLGGALAGWGCARSAPTAGGAAAGRATAPAGASDTADQGAPLIGLQRGGRWSVLTIKPPHLSGPHFHMVLRNSVLSGSISGGGAAPAGSLRVNIKEDGAEGFGPLGPVSLDIHVDDESTTAEGLWNGGRVHLVFSRGSLRGTVTANSYFHAKTNPSSAGGFERVRGYFPRPSNPIDTFDPLPEDTSCEYFLTEVAPDGALTGGSTCTGMPQHTRLEVPRIAETYMTHAELVTVLVAVLASPPQALAEGIGQPGPRFDGPSNQTRVPSAPRPPTTPTRRR
jgi:hypothetical protein